MTKSFDSLSTAFYLRKSKVKLQAGGETEPGEGGGIPSHQCGERAVQGVSAMWSDLGYTKVALCNMDKCCQKYLGFIMHLILELFSSMHNQKSFTIVKVFLNFHIQLKDSM